MKKTSSKKNILYKGIILGVDLVLITHDLLIHITIALSYLLTKARKIKIFNKFFRKIFFFIEALQVLLYLQSLFNKKLDYKELFRVIISLTILLSIILAIFNLNLYILNLDQILTLIHEFILPIFTIESLYHNNYYFTILLISILVLNSFINCLILFNTNYILLALLQNITNYSFTSTFILVELFQTLLEIPHLIYTENPQPPKLSIEEPQPPKLDPEPYPLPRKSLRILTFLNQFPQFNSEDLEETNTYPKL